MSVFGYFSFIQVMYKTAKLFTINVADSNQKNQKAPRIPTTIR